MVKLYGIRNCNSVRKAFDYLDEKNISYKFHDYKKLGISTQKLQEFVQYFGLEKVLNKKGTTWRKLSEEEQNKIVDDKLAIDLMVKNTSIIKRPIIELGSDKIIGFDNDEYDKTF